MGGLKTRVRRARDRVGMSPYGWATELGLVKYRPGPWSVQRWDAAYGGGQLEYFAGLSDRGRYSVLVGYLDALAPLGSVLDVGCGPGVLFARCRHLSFDRWSGFDLSPAAVAAASSLADARARFFAEDMLASEATWNGERYDCIVVNEVLNMCEDPAKLLALIKGALVGPESHVVISAWRHRGDRQLWSLIDRDFYEVDRVDLRSSSSRLAPRGWRVALLRSRSNPEGVGRS